MTGPVRAQVLDFLLHRIGKLAVFRWIFVWPEPDVADGLLRLPGCVHPERQGAGLARLSADAGIQQPPGKGGGFQDGPAHRAGGVRGRRGTDHGVESFWLLDRTLKGQAGGDGRQEPRPRPRRRAAAFFLLKFLADLAMRPRGRSSICVRHLARQLNRASQERPQLPGQNTGGRSIHEGEGSASPGRLAGADFRSRHTASTSKGNASTFQCTTPRLARSVRGWSQQLLHHVGGTGRRPTLASSQLYRATRAVPSAGCFPGPTESDQSGCLAKVVPMLARC